jgi:hypothetical protein
MSFKWLPVAEMGYCRPSRETVRTSRLAGGQCVVTTGEPTVYSIHVVSLVVRRPVIVVEEEKYKCGWRGDVGSSSVADCKRRADIETQ